MQKFFLALAVLASSAFAELTAEQVFWWWDDGLIEASDASDLLELIEDDDEDAACEMAEALGLEHCEKDEFAGKGYVRYRESRDSADSVILRKADAKLLYGAYSFKITIPGEWQIGYSRGRFEALFGNIAYKDIGILIPLEDYEGMWSAVRDDDFSVGGLLMSDTTFGAMFGAGPLAFWGFAGPGLKAFSASGQVDFANIAVFYADEMESPLFRAQVKYTTKTLPKFSWNGVVWAHSDTTMPEILNVTSSVKKSMIWSSQTQKLSLKGYSASFTEKLQVPINSDTGSVSTSLAGTFKKTAGTFRGLLGFACRDASSDCSKPQIRVEPQLVIGKATFYSKFRLQGDSFSELDHFPRVVAGAKISSTEKTFARAEFTYPEGGRTSSSPWRISEEGGLKAKNIQLSLRFVLASYPGEDFKPDRVGVTAKYIF